MHGCTVARNHLHWSTFSFSESRTAFSFADKRKSGFGPCWAGKKQLQGKNTPLSCKRKSGFTRRGYVPSVRRPSRATSATPSENHPPRRRGYQQTWYSIPPTQRQWRKKDHRSLKRKPPETRGIPQSPSPEGYHNSTNPTSGCTVPLHNLHWSTFSFSESRTTFSFAGQKKKWFYPQGVRPIRKVAKPPTAGLWPQLGRQKSDFPRKGYAPIRKAAQHPQGTSCL